MENLATDAAAVAQDQPGRSSVSLLGHNSKLIKEIQVEDLTPLELDLSVSEKIALIFLTYGSDRALCSAGLQNCLLLVENAAATLETSHLEQWARHCGGAVNWREILIESLCVVQAFHVTQKLGLYKTQLEEVYCPYRPETSLQVNKVLKGFYLAIETVEADVLGRCYPEIEFLQWIERQQVVLTPSHACNVDVAVKFFADLGLKEQKEDFERVVRVYQEQKVPLQTMASIDSRKQLNQNGIRAEPSVAPPALSNCYKVTRARCGYVLIVNQRSFTKDPNYQGLRDYSERKGTDVDCEALKKSFEARGYMVLVKSNLSHSEIIQELRKIVEASVFYDSLIVCVLSHGEEGVVIGANCIPIPIKEIQRIMASDKLLHKPKMLIIQACQGGAPQPLVRNSSVSSIETDGGTVETTSSPYADLLTALSTIGGYASMRDRISGTWYIQELCKVIDEHGDSDHVLDLLVIVNNQVSQKRATMDGAIVGQLPEANITLRKKFFLPKMNTDEM